MDPGCFAVLTVCLPKALLLFFFCKFLKNNQLWWEILAKEFLFLGFARNMSFLAKQITSHQAGGHRACPWPSNDCIPKRVGGYFTLREWTVPPALP